MLRLGLSGYTFKIYILGAENSGEKLKISDLGKGTGISAAVVWVAEWMYVHAKNLWMAELFLSCSCAIKAVRRCIDCTGLDGVCRGQPLEQAFVSDLAARRRILGRNAWGPKEDAAARR